MANYQTWKAGWDAAIFENTNNEISATDLNEGVTLLAQSVLWGFDSQANDVVVGTTPLTVVFDAPMNSTDYTLLTRCYDAQGNPIDCKVTNRTVNGFDVTGAVSGLMDYRVVQK